MIKQDKNWGDTKLYIEYVYNFLEVERRQKKLDNIVLKILSSFYLSIVYFAIC